MLSVDYYTGELEIKEGEQYKDSSVWLLRDNSNLRSLYIENNADIWTAKEIDFR